MPTPFAHCGEKEAIRRLEALDGKSPVHAAISPEVLTFIALNGGHMDLDEDASLIPLDDRGKLAAAIVDHGSALLASLDEAVRNLASETGNEAVTLNGKAVAAQVASAVAEAFSAVFDYNPGGAH